jgi:hypothetical protein
MYLLVEGLTLGPKDAPPGGLETAAQRSSGLRAATVGLARPWLGRMAEARRRAAASVHWTAATRRQLHTSLGSTAVGSVQGPLDAQLGSALTPPRTARSCTACARRWAWLWRWAAPSCCRPSGASWTSIGRRCTMVSLAVPALAHLRAGCPATARVPVVAGRAAKGGHVSRSAAGAHPAARRGRSAQGRHLTQRRAALRRPRPPPGNIPGSHWKKPFICPADHVLDLEGGWHAARPEFGPHLEYREYSFFANPR